MVVGGSRQETLNPGFVLLGTRQQGVPVILRELVLPGGFLVGMFLDELQKVQIQYLGAETNNFPTLLFNYVHQHVS
ncbi:unnamed protein product [Schistosoma curassoni]|uniref:Uncharacterized protein n=1 Tax=Schistosoma curassoni TaxID=6186 RepID=A0A183KZ16_9TREM|nr:unnamed protein product [Schistosoma curassoni]